MYNTALLVLQTELEMTRDLILKFVVIAITNQAMYDAQNITFPHSTMPKLNCSIGNVRKYRVAVCVGLSGSSTEVHYIVIMCCVLHL